MRPWQAVSVCPPTLAKYAEQPEPAYLQARSVQPRGSVTDRASVVPPAAMTSGELAGKLAGP